ncbi:MAG: hypothetical protein AAGF44_01630 [Pseudomonadota bacterium]
MSVHSGTIGLLRSFYRSIFQRISVAAAAVTCALAALGWPTSDALAQERCDWPAFEKPCQVPGGVYRALAPSGPGPHRTVVYLYGSTGHSREITEAAFFQQIVDQFDYALIVPAAKDVNYRGGTRDTGWSLRHGQKTRDEVSFLKAVLQDAEERFSIDRENILFMGQSRGGFLIWELACHNPELGSAWAVHAGGYLGPLPERCKQPVKFLHTHGTEDRIVRYSGMRDVSGDTDMVSVNSALAMLQRTNDCDPRSEAPDGRIGPFTRYEYRGCDQDGALQLMLHKGGHSFPGAWFKTVIDWFEGVNSGPGRLQAADPSNQGKSIRFQGSSTGGLLNRNASGETAGGRFKSVPSQ